MTLLGLLFGVVGELHGATKMVKRPGEESVVAQELGSEVVVLTSREIEEDEGSDLANVMFALVVGVVVKMTVQFPDNDALPFVANVAVEEEPSEI